MPVSMIEGEGRRVEYAVLRSEILHLDRICLVILGLLITASGSVVGLIDKLTDYGLLNLLPPLWFIGWCYISEKRFMLRRTARYLRHEVEGDRWGLGWQRWLERTREELASLYPRFEPYLLETIITALVVIAVPVYLVFKCSADWHSFSIKLDMVVILAFALVVIRIMPKYMRHHRVSDVVE